MKSPLEALRNIREEGCVSIILNTHRTSPQSHGDVIQVKNLTKRVQEKLEHEYPKDLAKRMLAKLEAFTAEIDHTKNQDSMAIFVSESVETLHRMTVPVRDRVEVGGSFALRDLVRAENESAGYYVVVISRQNARLIEAHNADVIRDEFDGFPIVNETLFETDPLKLTMATGQDNLIEEFFNRVDIKVMELANKTGLPIILATEERNYHHYMRIANNAKRIIGHLTKNRDDEPSNRIVADCWPIVHKAIMERNAERIGDLRKAVSTGLFLSDINDIYRAILEGRGRVLYVREDYHQPGVITPDNIEMTNGNSPVGHGSSDDVIGDLVRGAMDRGGEVVFIRGNELEKFEGLALLTRY